MELWDVYDKDRIPTGRTMVRGSEFMPGDYHLVVHVCIFNSKGEMLIQQRQPFKEGWPDRWDFTVGGSAVTGDSSQTAAMREVAEEIGLSINLMDKRPNYTVNFQYGFDDFYLVNMDVDIDKLKLQYEEVKQVKWATRETILKMIESKEFIPYFDSMVNLLFDARDGLTRKEEE